MDDLAIIASRTDFNLDGPIQTTREAKAEFEEHQEAYADQKYEEWKEQRHEIRDDDRTLDDLFDSLR